MLAVLGDVYEFMREQALASGVLRAIGAGAEEDVLTGGDGGGIERVRGGGGLGVGVDADCAEIVADSSLHEPAGGWVERLAGGA